MFEFTSSSKYRTEKLETKNQRYRNTKNENIDGRKPSFNNRRGRKVRLI